MGSRQRAGMGGIQGKRRPGEPAWYAYKKGRPGVILPEIELSLLHLPEQEATKLSENLFHFLSRWVTVIYQETEMVEGNHCLHFCTSGFVLW